MNICVIGGRVVRNATVKGTDRKILRFAVETWDGHDDSENKERVNQVPSVLFDPTPELEQTLSSQGEGLKVELQGRIATWGDNNGKSGAEVSVSSSFWRPGDRIQATVPSVGNRGSFNQAAAVKLEANLLEPA